MYIFCWDRKSLYIGPVHFVPKSSVGNRHFDTGFRIWSIVVSMYLLVLTVFVRATLSDAPDLVFTVTVYSVPTLRPVSALVVSELVNWIAVAPPGEYVNS